VSGGEIEPIDKALIEAAEVALFAERHLDLSLLPWQQRIMDHVFVSEALGQSFVFMKEARRER
jgi:hypothetical protein